MRNWLAVLIVSIASAACGTGVYHHDIEVTINDPSKRLGPPPIEISFFDKNGYSEDWARRTIGTTEPGKPYSGKTWGTDTKMFYDRTPSMFVDGGLFLPAFETRGYYELMIRPVSGTEQTTTLKYASFGVKTREEDAIPPLAAHYRSKGSSKGWTIHLTVDVPPLEPKQP